MGRVINATVFVIILSCIFASPATAGFDELYEAAIKTNPLVKKAHDEGVERRNAEAKQLSTLLQKVETTTCEGDLHKAVVGELEKDLAKFIAVNKQLTTQKQNARIQTTTNKMVPITNAALAFAKKKENIDLLLEGKLPEGYSLKVPQCNAFPDDGHIFSSGRKANALKAVLARLWMLQNNKPSLKDLVSVFGPSWIDTSPWVHITPLPDDFDMSVLAQSPHVFSDDKTPKGMLTILNGYAFGGHRWEARYQNTVKVWGPEDCSSFVAKRIGSKMTFATSDMAWMLRSKLGNQFLKHNDTVPVWNVHQQKKFASMEDVITPLGLILPQANIGIGCGFDPQKLKPGFIHTEVKYNQRRQPSSGHTGIYLGTDGSGPDTKAVTLGANRDLDGTGKEFIYGVEARPFFSTATTPVMIFEVSSNK